MFNFLNMRWVNYLSVPGFPVCSCQFLSIICLFLSVPVWSCLILSDPVWSCLFLSVPVCSSMFLSVPVCSCLCLSVPVCSCLFLSDPVWSCLFLSDPVCSGLCLSMIALFLAFLETRWEDRRSLCSKSSLSSDLVKTTLMSADVSWCQLSCGRCRG